MGDVDNFSDAGSLTEIPTSTKISLQTAGTMALRQKAQMRMRIWGNYLDQITSPLVSRQCIGGRFISGEILAMSVALDPIGPMGRAYQGQEHDRQ